MRFEAERFERRVHVDQRVGEEDGGVQPPGLKPRKSMISEGPGFDLVRSRIDEEMEVEMGWRWDGDGYGEMERWREEKKRI